MRKACWLLYFVGVGLEPRYSIYPIDMWIHWQLRSMKGSCYHSFELVDADGASQPPLPGRKAEDAATARGHPSHMEHLCEIPLSGTQ